MNFYLVIILAILIAKYVLEMIVETANLRYFHPRLPRQFIGYFDAERYRKSQLYLKDNTRLDLLAGAFFLVLTLGFILLGGFEIVDQHARGFALSPIPTGLIFAGTLVFISSLLHLPFSVYDTFVLEEKYGFNTTTPKTFILDLLKGLLLTFLIGGPLFAGIIWFFRATGSRAWLYCWGAVTLYELFLLFIAPVTIMPLFNKFIPLEEGELKTAIERYAAAQKFKMKGIFKMDASRRSTKSNAFFCGFGRFRRIVLFDTLIRKHSVDELVAILAHEMGHYRKKHVFKTVLISILSTGLMFFILSLFINNPQLFAAFRMTHVSVYASLFFFAFLYAPIAVGISIFTNFLSRRFEYGADAYAASTFGKPEALISGLKKMSVDNLSNLTPHPLKVFLDYGHPPVLERIKALEAFQPDSRPGEPAFGDISPPRRVRG